MHVGVYQAGDHDLAPAIDYLGVPHEDRAGSLDSGDPIVLDEDIRIWNVAETLVHGQRHCPTDEDHRHELAATA